MGWYYGCGTKRELVHDLTCGESLNIGKTRKCLAHCYRGNAHSGVLWTVWTIIDSSTGAEITRFIGCDIMHFRGGEWGSKSLDERSHPYYYSCPLGYLEMVPEECPEWRAKVRAYHAKRAKKLVVGETYLATSGLRVGSRKIKAIKVVSLKPLRGDAIFEDNGCLEQVKFSKKHVGDAVA